MHMITIILAVGLLIHDAFADLESTLVGNGAVYALAVMLLPKLLLLVIYRRLCSRAVRHPTSTRLKRLDRLGSQLRLAMLGSYGIDLLTGCLTWVRMMVGDWVLLDELLFLLPTLGTQLMFWRMYYPVDRRLREAMAYHAVDRGDPVPPIWSMRQYLIAQVRHSLMIPGVPLLLLLGWTEALNMAPRSWLILSNGTDIQSTLSLSGTFVVFLFTPVMIRYLWDTQSMPDSPMRSRLLGLCKHHRVGIRDILYWKTSGGMANGAVIGFVGKLRYILLTDVLLSQMSPSCIEAVMAHEIAHVRKKHMFWMIAAAGSMMVIYEMFFGVLFWYMGVQFSNQLIQPQLWQSTIDTTAMLIGMLMAGGLWVVSFGWISRRMERQADSFAVAHMAQANGHVRIEPEDAHAMIQALDEVAGLNHVRIEKKSWRHGSIAWRQEYLRTLVSQKASRLPIDRTMRWVCLLIVLGALLSAWLLNGGLEKIENYLLPPQSPKVYVI